MTNQDSPDNPNDAPSGGWNVRGKPERMTRHEILILALLLIGDVLDAQLFWRRMSAAGYRGLVAAVPRPPAGAAEPAGSVFWIPAALLFILPGGILLTPAAVRAAVRSAAARAALEQRADNARLLAGQMPLAAWQEAFINRVVALHVAAAAVGAGGANQLTVRTLARSAEEIPADVSAVKTLGDFIAFHVGRAVAFAADIGNRATNADTPGKINARTDMYNAAAVGAFALGQRDAAAAADFTFERNVLTAAEHCTPRAGSDVPDCPGETARGWVPLGSLAPIGGRVCGPNCKCFFEFSRTNSDAGMPAAEGADNPETPPEPAPA
jgi:hypothetical protein